LAELKSHEWCTSKCKYYHKAVISGGLPGDFIVYRHRAFRKTLVGFAHPGGVYNNFMALNSLLCAHVPLRNCSLTHSLGSGSWTISVASLTATLDHHHHLFAQTEQCKCRQ